MSNVGVYLQSVQLNAEPAQTNYKPT